MYYIGYTSVISGGEDDTIFDYADWCYGAELSEDELPEEDDAAGRCDRRRDTTARWRTPGWWSIPWVISSALDAEDPPHTTSGSGRRQGAGSSTPSTPPHKRDRVVMACFDDEANNERINRMWINALLLVVV